MYVNFVKNRAGYQEVCFSECENIRFLQQIAPPERFELLAPKMYQHWKKISNEKYIIRISLCYLRRVWFTKKNNFYYYFLCAPNSQIMNKFKKINIYECKHYSEMLCQWAIKSYVWLFLCIYIRVYIYE